MSKMGPSPLPFDQRLARSMRVDPATGCWNWTLKLTAAGYGRLYWRGSYIPAHRWTYEHLVAAVPPELHMDHLCRNRACVNPAHLEPVTPTENKLRGFASRGYPDRCARGHSRAEHGRVYPDGRTQCRECKRIKERERLGRPSRERRTQCQFCNRQIGEQNLSRHERVCSDSTEAAA